MCIVPSRQPRAATTHTATAPRIDYAAINARLRHDARYMQEIAPDRADRALSLALRLTACGSLQNESSLFYPIGLESGAHTVRPCAQLNKIRTFYIIASVEISAQFGGREI